MRGELAEIVPFDDDEMHKAAHPIKAGKVVLSGPDIEAREEAMVARLLTSAESVSVIVLGAAHNLKDRLERHGVEYRRIMPSQVEQLLEGIE